MKGFKVGPLDPEPTREFGPVNAVRTARDLLRRHRALYPGELSAALSRPTNEPRSRGLDRGEVERAVRAWWEKHEDGLPEGFAIAGAAAVHGADGGPQFVGYVYTLASGRSGKAALPYDAKTFPKSYASGTMQTEIEEAKEAGRPWQPTGDDAAAAAALEKSGAEKDAQIAELEKQLAEARAAGGDESTGEEGEAEGGSPSAPADPVEPWPGFSEANVDALRPLLKDIDAETAGKVLAYELANKNRGSVVSAANAILDRPPGD